MSRLADLLDFYGRTGWKKDDSGVLVPTIELVADRGKMAQDYMRPSEKGVPPEDIVKANYIMSAAEIAEASRDLLLAINMVESNTRAMKIGSLCIQLQNAEYRLRMVTRT